MLLYGPVEYVACDLPGCYAQFTRVESKVELTAAHHTPVLLVPS